MAAISAFGAELLLGGTKVANVLSVAPPSKTREAIDATDHDSEDGIAEYIDSGVIRLGEVSVTIHYIPGSTGDAAIHTKMDAGGLHTFEVRERAATGKWATSGNAIITGYEPSASEIEGKLTATVTLQPSGPITRAAVTP